MNILFKYPCADRLYYKGDSIFNGFPYYEYEKFKPDNMSDERWEDFVGGGSIPKGLLTYLIAMNMLMSDTGASEDEWVENKDYALLYTNFDKKYDKEDQKYLLAQFLMACINYMYAKEIKDIREIFENLANLWEISDISENYQACRYFVKLRLEEKAARMAFYNKVNIYPKPEDYMDFEYTLYLAEGELFEANYKKLCSDIDNYVSDAVDDIMKEKITFRHADRVINEIVSEYAMDKKSFMYRQNRQIEEKMVKEAVKEYADLITQKEYCDVLYEHLDKYVFPIEDEIDFYSDYLKLCFTYGSCLEGRIDDNNISVRKISEDADKCMEITISDDNMLEPLFISDHFRINGVEYDLHYLCPERDYRVMDVEFLFCIHTLIDSRISEEYIGEIAKELIKRDRDKYEIKYSVTSNGTKKF